MTTAAKHTAGPWLVDRKEPGELWIADTGRNYPICMVTGAGFVTERDEADARLIAAAPDLLDFAHNVAGLDDRALTRADLNYFRSLIREFRDEARAAIAKAEGGAA